MDVYDGKGQVRKLGEQVGGGGQGNVYLAIYLAFLGVLAVR